MIHFDIDWENLTAISDELGGTEKQLRFALSFALRRTATRLRALSARGLRTELELVKLSHLRKRLRQLKLSKGRGGVEGVQLRYGLNDMPVSWFKGRASKTATGASFRGQEFKGGFIGFSKVKGKNTIFKRAGRARLAITEQLMGIEDKARVYIEDEIFVQLEDIFWPIFKREIAARIKYKIGEA